LGNGFFKIIEFNQKIKSCISVGKREIGITLK